MSTVVDVAAYILDHYGSMTTMKLQKLAFYSQAHCLVNRGRCLFEEDFQAWVNGPASPDLFDRHRGKFLIRSGELAGASESHSTLSPHETEEVDAACSRLAPLTGNQLSIMTHQEDPWRLARKGYGPSDYCDVLITIESIRTFYSSHPTWEFF